MFTYDLNTPINELEAEALEYIAFQVEEDSYLSNIDVCYMDEDEIAALVTEHMGLLDY